MVYLVPTTSLTTMDNDQLLEEMLEQAQEDGIIYDDATYALEIEYTTQS